MSKFDRVFNVIMGIGCASTVMLVALHVVQPSAITMAVVNAIAVTASCFIAFVGYDMVKEGLTGKRQ